MKSVVLIFALAASSLALADLGIFQSFFKVIIRLVFITFNYICHSDGVLLCLVMIVVLFSRVAVHLLQGPSSSPSTGPRLPIATSH